MAVLGMPWAFSKTEEKERESLESHIDEKMLKDALLALRPGFNWIKG